MALSAEPELFQNSILVFIIFDVGAENYKGFLLSGFVTILRNIYQKLETKLEQSVLLLKWSCEEEKIISRRWNSFLGEILTSSLVNIVQFSHQLVNVIQLNSGATKYISQDKQVKSNKDFVTKSKLNILRRRQTIHWEPFFCIISRKWK